MSSLSRYPASMPRPASTLRRARIQIPGTGSEQELTILACRLGRVHLSPYKQLNSVGFQQRWFATAKFQTIHFYLSGLGFGRHFYVTRYAPSSVFRGHGGSTPRSERYLCKAKITQDTIIFFRTTERIRRDSTWFLTKNSWLCKAQPRL